MQTASWHRIERIFDDALACPETERAAFLGTACAGDAALQREVEALLAARQEAEQFFGTWAAGSSPNGTATATATERIGPYQLLRELAQGGMGTVWLAERADDQYQQQVAIKLLKTNSPDIAQRLRHERQILADLNHPNIARLLDGGTTDSGQPYLVMEFIEGVPIDDYCQRHQLGLRARLQLFRQVCAAVQYAHQHLIIHRDLKPANILVTTDGTPKLLDFGIAKLLQPDLQQSYQTQAGQTPMTPAYASPEQVRSEALTTTSDVYSLGVLLYELLTGRSPYQLKANTFGELSKAICEQEPTRPSTEEGEKGRKGEREKEETCHSEVSLTPPLPFSPSQLRGDLDSIVLMALRKEPSARYSSVEQFSADIQRYLDGLPTLARKGTFAYRAVKYVRRYKAPVAAAALILLSLLGGIGATSRQAQIARVEQAKAEAQRIRAEQALAVADEQRRRAEQALAEVEAERTRAENALTTAEQRRRQAEAARAEANQQRAAAEAERNVAQTQRQFADEQRQRAEAQELSNRQLLYTSRMGLAYQAWDDANIGRMRELLNHYLPQTGEPDYRSFEWFYLWKLAHSEQKMLSFTGNVRATAFSADGRQLLSVAQNGTFASGTVEVSIHDVATGQRQQQFVRPMATIIAITPDRTALALAQQGGTEISLVALPAGTEFRKIGGLTRRISCLAFSLDRTKLVIGFHDGSISLFEVATGNELYRVKAAQEAIFSLAVAPDGQTFVTAGLDASTKLWQLTSGRELFTFPKNIPASNFDVQFSPDGRMVVVIASGFLKAWEVATGKELANLENRGRYMVFTPDSQTLITAGEDAANQTELNFLDTRTWKETGVLKGHGNPVASLAVSPDGKQLASSSFDKTVLLWSLEQGTETTIIDEYQNFKRGLFRGAALTPDGKRLLVGQSKLSNQAATVWDVTTGKEIITLAGHVLPSPQNNNYFAVAASPDGKLFATGGRDAQVIIWDAVTGQQRASLKAPSFVRELSFSPDGKTLIAGCGNAARLWDLRSGEELDTLTDSRRGFSSLAFTPDGNRFLTTTGDSTVKLWSLSTRQVLKEYQCSAPISSLAVSPDGTLLITGLNNGVAQVWDVATGRELMMLKGHTSGVTAMALSPDGKRLATGSPDKTVRLWDLTTGQELIALKGRGAGGNAIGFSKDGLMLYTTTADRVVRIWRAATEQEVTARR